MDDDFKVCGWCGTSSDGVEDPSFESAAANESSTAANGVPAAEATAVAEARVTVATARLPEHAHTVRCHLEAAGIAVFVPDEPPQGMDWASRPGGVIELQVRDADLERAKRVLADIPPEEVVSQPHAPAPAPAAEAAPPAPVGAPPAEAPPAVAPSPPASSPATWEPDNKESLTGQEYIRALESKLSSLMDDYDTPGWKVNPAFHPDVTAFIQGHSQDAGFVKRAQSMQQNRAKYYATMRARGDRKPAPTPQPASAPAAVPAPVEAKTRPPRSRLRRVAVWAVFLLLLLVGGVVGGAAYWDYLSEQQLQSVIAQLDESDPGWRWDDLQKQRAAVPDEQNAALRVLSAAEELPPDWTAEKGIAKEVLDLEPTRALSEEQKERLLEAYMKWLPSVRDGRALGDYSTGRYPAREAKEVLTGRGRIDWKALRRVAQLMRLDAVWRVHDDAPNGALASGRAILIVGRSVGDDPDPLTQMARLECQSTALASIERTLAQGEPTEGALALTQKLLEDELDQPLLLYTLRGHRAWVQLVEEQREAGTLPDLLPDDDLEKARLIEDRDSVPGQVERWLTAGWKRENRALALVFLSEAVELAKLPVDQQPAAFKEFKQKSATRFNEQWPRYGPGRLPVSPVLTYARVSHQRASELRCAVVALAAERFRIVNDRWPESVDELGDYLTKSPTDIYTGKPLLLNRLDDGIVIYSVGPDGEDNGGTLPERNAKSLKDKSLKGKDLGFRLWDVGRRRQPPPEAEHP